LKSTFQNHRIGILGGGQLGRMLIQAGLDFNLTFSVLDPDSTAPCSTISNFSMGDITDFETVMNFGESCDLITVEIENVNCNALQELVNKGKKVFPQPHLLALIQDKRTQKEFFKANEIPTADFILVNNKSDIANSVSFLPAVNKLAREGYDGKGVQVIEDESKLFKAFDAPGLLEKLIDFDKEISIIVARNENGEISSFPAVEMVFLKEANLVEYLKSPASIDEKILNTADLIARKIIETMQLVGILAVEMFVTKEGDVLVNEVAPRPHNSGHQTIEANNTSQYEQHLRAILNLPLGDTTANNPSVMVNLLGERDYSGIAKYTGLEEVLKIKGVHVHLYGKNQTRPFRKMGHVTIVDQDFKRLNQKRIAVKEILKVIA